LDIDPGFALCWAELSRAFAIEAGRVWVPVSEGFDRARDAARRSLVLEPDLAEGHAQLGRVQLTYDWDLRGAERSYARALELAPGSSSVLDGAAVLAYKLGHLQEALDLYRSVLVQDPLSAAFWHNLGLAAHTAGLLAEAERAFHKALELVPQRLVSRALLSLVLLDQGRTDQALEQAAAEPYEMWRLWAQTIVFHAAGRSAESEEALRILIEEHAIGNAYQIAEIHSIRGDVDRAFDWLERAIDERDSGLTHLKVNPHFRALLDDKRWNEMLKKIGFEV
jgi:tetratricopeptide (TPR) repeat protein